MSIKYHYNHWLPPLLGFDGVTLGNHIFFKTNNPPEWLIQHELVHVRQFKEHGFLGFLIKYYKEYVLGRLKGLSHWDAYNKISFEIEAYELDKKYR